MSITLPARRTAALALATGASGFILIGFVHPTTHAGNVVTQLVRLSPHLAAVHVLGIAAAAALLFGFTVFSMIRGLGRSTVLGALVVYAFAMFAFALAAAIDGFIVPGIAVLAAGWSTSRSATTDELRACGWAVQVFAKGGMLCVAAAIAFWSLDLARERGVRRSIGALGCAVAVGSATFAFTTARIGPHALVTVGLLQAIWYVAIAALLAADRV